MPNEIDPIAGEWYLHKDKGEMFRVVALDARGGVEIQYFGGDVEELDPEAWREADIETAAAPEDWTGPFDDVQIDDLGRDETAMSAQDWQLALEPLQRTEKSWQDSRAPDEIEEEEDGRPLEAYLEETRAAEQGAGENQ